MPLMNPFQGEHPFRMIKKRENPTHIGNENPNPGIHTAKIMAETINMPHRFKAFQPLAVHNQLHIPAPRKSIDCERAVLSSEQQ